MSYETAGASFSRSIPPPALPPSLHLSSPLENNDSFNRPGGSRFISKSFNRAFHQITLPRQFATTTRLEGVVKASKGNENVVSSTRPSHSMECRTPSHRTSRPPSTASNVSQSTTSRISTIQHPPTTLIAPFPPLNLSDIPSRSPTNKSPFSAVLLTGRDEDFEDDNLGLALCHTEQLHRARLAKLTRHLGEEIPAEMVLSPAFLSHGTPCSSICARRSGYHYKYRSLDHSALTQASSATGPAKGLSRSRSLKGQGDDCPAALSVTGTQKVPSTEYSTGGDSGAKNTTNTMPSPALFPGTTSKTHSNLPMSILNGDVPDERASIDTCSDHTVSCSSRLSVEASRENSPLSLHASLIPSRSATLPRRSQTADASRRVEKLANFFGVGHEDVQTLGTTPRLQFSYTSATGNLAIRTHTLADSQLEVKVFKPTRFWNGRVTTKTARPGDVLDMLRMMRAS